jgi:hypothetical protein
MKVELISAMKLYGFGWIGFVRDLLRKSEKKGGAPLKMAMVFR